MPGLGRRVALLLEYDGAAYAGSQYQPDSPTVQAVLEEAIGRTTGEPARAAFAGRTDAGVHALGQVAAFSTASRLDADTLVRALNNWLPRDVAGLAARDVRSDFDPRRHAVGRVYRYRIVNRSVRPALDRARAWHVAQPLELAPMADAASRLLGRRDFRAFSGALEDPEASTVRELRAFTVRRDEDSLTFEVEANAFLPHQVRRMVGALVEVGLGRITPADYEALLQGPLASAGPAAPPHGLYLERVDYPEPVFGEPLLASSRTV